MSFRIILKAIQEAIFKPIEINKKNRDLKRMEEV